MNRPIETHNTTLQKVSAYVGNLKSQYEKDTQENALTESEKIDVLGGLDTIRKEIEKFLKEQRALIVFSKGKEVFGTSYKAKATTSDIKEIMPETLFNALPKSSFFLCVKVVTKKVETFITDKKKIEELKTKVGEKKAVSFEKI